MINGFIDIHCHILPGLDDGSLTLNETEEMLSIAREDGISGIVATPHSMNGVYNNIRKTIHEAIAELKIRSDDCQVYIGAEVRIGRDLLTRIIEGELPLINDKRYLLLELPAYGIPPMEDLENIIKNLSSYGITPIFPHPERNIPLINDLSIMNRMIKCGALFQVTAMSVTGQFGSAIREAAHTMIKYGYIHAVASDAHNGKNRPPVLSEAYKVVLNNFGEYEAKQLFMYNPFRIINGESIVVSQVCE